MRSETKTLILSLRILARDIEAPDSVPECCLREAADRLEELDDALAEARKTLRYIRTAAALRLTDPDDAVMRDFMRVCDAALDDRPDENSP